ncbi:hypothetical protein CLOM_g23153 [Closterium sp. NIES-68]|nr:hypothetical protein CLOM_g23153 [Closterium sp. NIES-68]
MGKPGCTGKWELDVCLNGSTWKDYLTHTAPTRPGNTGAVACVFVKDGERTSFERRFGSIRDNTLNVSSRRPNYCPKTLELTTVYATNGTGNIDLMQRYSEEIPLALEGKRFYTWPFPLANPSDHRGFAVDFPVRRSLPTNDTKQPTAAAAAYGTLGAVVDVTLIAKKVLEELYEPDPSKSFELYDVTDPSSIFAIVSPVPAHAYMQPGDALPHMHPSPASETRPWESPAVVPLDELRVLMRNYEVWCRHIEPPSVWQSWGIPILIALLTLLLVLLVLAAAWLQRAKFFQTQEQVVEADRLRKKAEAAEASKSMFVACMSHELRTPMVGIIGMLDALADRPLPSPELSDLVMARASARDALRLINRVLDLAKLEAGKAVVDETAVDVRVWLDTVLECHVEDARSKSIELRGTVDDDVPTRIIADQMHLSKVLKEITENAVRFTAQGHVTVRVSLVPQGTSLQHTLQCQGLSTTTPHTPTSTLATWACAWGWKQETASSAASSAAVNTPDESETAHDRRVRKRHDGRPKRRRDGQHNGNGRPCPWSCPGPCPCVLVLSCQDSGCGFPASLHRADGSGGASYFSLVESREQREARSGSGTALGLVLVQHMVTLMKGELAFDSRPGCGSTVAFCVPVTTPFIQEHCLEETYLEDQNVLQEQSQQQQWQGEVAWHRETQERGSREFPGAASSCHEQQTGSGDSSGAINRMPLQQHSVQVVQRNPNQQQQQQQWLPLVQSCEGSFVVHGSGEVLMQDSRAIQRGRSKSERVDASERVSVSVGASYPRAISVPPSSAAAAGTHAAAAAAQTRACLTGLRILVVDDTPINLMVARRTLTRWGAAVATAKSGAEAVEMVGTGMQGMEGEEAVESVVADMGEARGQEAVGEEAVEMAGEGIEERRVEDVCASLRHGYDLVLMDLQMPGMDGFTAAAAIRAHERRLQFEATRSRQQQRQQAALEADPQGRDWKRPAGVDWQRPDWGEDRQAPAADWQPPAAENDWPALPRVPIVALTADVDCGVVQRCAEGGFDGVLQKPVDAHLLAAHLSQAQLQLSLRRVVSHPTVTQRN